MKEKNKDISKPRVRLAPSPTGYLHVGTARTALYNYLFAKKHQGAFVLRIEDTDEGRSSERYEQDVLRHLTWLGLDWDEGPTDADNRRIKTQINADEKKREDPKKRKGGYGPYRQSKRKDIYKKYLEKLLQEGKAFYCFHEKRRLMQDGEEINADNRENKNAENRGNKESRVHWCEHKDLSKKEVNRRLEEGEEHVIRFRTPKDKEIKFEDEIRGEITYNSSELGDFSIAKTPDEPLYNLACVVDDHKMEISHVIRGEDHIPNTPKQVLLYEAFGFEKPKFAHLPLILGEDGEKLSKRHGATAVREYKKRGYIPLALNNFMALLGWHPKGNRELFLSLEELVEAFSLERIRPSGAEFNEDKLGWFNKQHFKEIEPGDFANKALPYLKEAGFIEEKGGELLFLRKGESHPFSYLEKIVALEQKRAETLSEIPALTDFFFEEKIDYDKKLLLWKDFSLQQVRRALKEAKEVLAGIAEEEFRKEQVQKRLLKKGEAYEDRGLLLWPLRVALTGKEGSPGPFEVAAILGKEESLRRVEQAIKMLS